MPASVNVNSRRSEKTSFLTRHGHAGPLSRLRSTSSPGQPPSVVQVTEEDMTLGLNNAQAATGQYIGSIRLIPFVEFSSRTSLNFEPMERKVYNSTRIQVGRFTDKSQAELLFAFKSKVVSRNHAELWCDKGKWYIRDVKSSSGTFLNHVRLSAPGAESKPTLLQDGDCIQFGIDFRGGTEEIYRCVKTRVEMNRIFQQNTDEFNKTTYMKLRSLTTPMADDGTSAYAAECCICLFAIAPSQALFVAPCSHAYHFKCIRLLLLQNHPNFMCCLCRKYADLEASVEVESEAWVTAQTRLDDPRTPVCASEESQFDSLRAVLTVLPGHATDEDALVSSESVDRESGGTLYTPSHSMSRVHSRVRDVRLDDPGMRTPLNSNGPFLIDSAV